jgi:hypothetical protein
VATAHWKHPIVACARLHLRAHAATEAAAFAGMRTFIRCGEHALAVTDSSETFLFSCSQFAAIVRLRRVVAYPH